VSTTKRSHKNDRRRLTARERAALIVDLPADLPRDHRIAAASHQLALHAAATLARQRERGR